MVTLFPRLLMLALCSSFMVGCASTPPQTEASPSPAAPSITAPINKANETSKIVEQKSQEREQLNPAAQPSPSP